MSLEALSACVNASKAYSKVTSLINQRRDWIDTNCHGKLIAASEKYENKDIRFEPVDMNTIGEMAKDLLRNCFIKDGVFGRPLLKNTRAMKKVTIFFIKLVEYEKKSRLLGDFPTIRLYFVGVLFNNYREQAVKIFNQSKQVVKQLPAKYLTGFLEKRIKPYAQRDFSERVLRPSLNEENFPEEKKQAIKDLADKFEKAPRL